MYTGNIRGKYRPRDNIQMAGHMDLKTVTQETVKQVKNKIKTRFSGMESLKQIKTT